MEANRRTDVLYTANFVLAHGTKMAARQDPQDSSLEARLQAMGLKDTNSTTFNAQAILSAFRSNEDEVQRQRALAAVALARRVQNETKAGSLVEELVPVIRTSLTDAADQSEEAALRLLATLYAIAPQHAHEILCDNNGVPRMLHLLVPALSSSGSNQVDFLRAQVLCAAAEHAASRGILKGDEQVQRWLSVRKSVNADADGSASPVALACQLTAYKLDHGPTESEQAGVVDQNKVHDVSEDDRLFSSARDAVKAAKEQSSTDDTQRSTLVLALEALGYLSTTPRLKQKMTDDDIFLRALCGLNTAGDKKPSVFPSRDSNQATRSSYDVSPAASGVQSPTDSSLSYALATILANLTALKPLLTSEQKQMAKLKAMASNNPTAGTEDEDPQESTPAIEVRGDRVVEAGGVKTLVAIALGTQSDIVRTTVAQAILNLTTKQDRIRRGKIIQDGGARALLVLCAARAQQDAPTSSPHPFSSSTNTSSTYLAPNQSLAQLSITTSPLLLFHSENGCNSAIKPLTTLLLNPISTPLQRFEALMALTNLSSLNESLANQICNIPQVIQSIEDSISDTNLIRQAAVELLCNCLSAGVESLYSRWAGKEAKSRLHLLLALSAAGQSIQLRLAASASIAMLCQASHTACHLVLSLQEKTLMIVQHLVLLAVDDKIQEITDDDDDDAHDELTMEQRLSLSLRGITLAESLLSNDEANKLPVGIHNAIKRLSTSVMQSLRQWVDITGGKPRDASDAALVGLQREIAQIALRCKKRA